jgi:hypothetical protein
VSTQAVDRPFVAGDALRSVNFFNGRLLTGDDLSREQAAQATRLHRLGRLVGAGVAEGFEVTETIGTSTHSRPVVTVSAGLALTRSGVALDLPADVDVSLYRDHHTDGAEPGALFADCQPFAPGTYTAGAGVYLLTVAPAEIGEGRAAVNGLGNETAPCTIALEAEALRFRLIRLALPLELLADKGHLRNRVAYLCFGQDALAGEVADPFGSPVVSYGLLDILRKQTLTDDEVPLATIGWSIADGIEFVDLWSVRRRLTRLGAEGDWTALAGDRRRAEGEAMFLQFQQQIADLALLEADPPLLRVVERFTLLPAAGLVPLHTSNRPLGFDQSTFFAGLTTTDQPDKDLVFIEGAKLADLLAESFRFPPIDLASEEAIRLYVVRENEQGSASGLHTQPYALFVNGHMAYRGDGQFDLSYWDNANYAQAYC